MPVTGRHGMSLYGDAPVMKTYRVFVSFFFKDTATTEIYTLSLHDALPICISRCQPGSVPAPRDLPVVICRLQTRARSGATKDPVRDRSDWQGISQ